VFDRTNKRKKANQQKETPLMSGALGDMPPAAPKPGKGSNLIPDAPDADTPPPWDDKGPPAARIRMTVTSGFYVRSFCHDLGAKVSSSALMAELCRSRQGDFVLGGSNCLEFSDLAKGEDVWAPQVKAMLDLWNAKKAIAPQSPLRAKQNKSLQATQSATLQQNRTTEEPRHSSPSASKELEKLEVEQSKTDTSITTSALDSTA
jgi:tRNA pseudouridine55 synthase